MFAIGDVVRLKPWDDLPFGLDRSYIHRIFGDQYFTVKFVQDGFLFFEETSFAMVERCFNLVTSKWECAGPSKDEEKEFNELCLNLEIK